MRTCAIMTRNPRAGFLKYLAIGCLTIIMIAVLGMIIAWRNRHTLIAKGVESAMTATIQASDIPADQKERLLTQVRELTQDIRDKKISVQDFQNIAQEFAGGPLLPLGMVAAAREQYFQGATLTDEAKADADLAFQRFIRGVIEGKIKMDQMDRVMQIIISEQPGNRRELKKLDEADRTKLLEAVKEIADAAAMPNEPFELDYAREFEKIMDRALGREVLDDVEDFDGGTTPSMNTERPDSAAAEIPALSDPKEFPGGDPAQR